jgi:hypothetical protein
MFRKAEQKLAETYERAERAEVRLKESETSEKLKEKEAKLRETELSSTGVEWKLVELKQGLKRLREG